MKKYFKFLAVLSAAVLSFAACNEEPQPTPDFEGETHTIKFVAGAPETKTTVENQGGAAVYSWEDSDLTRIHVFEDGVEGTVNVEGSDVEADYILLSVTFPGPADQSHKYTANLNGEVKNEQCSTDTYDADSDVLVAYPVTTAAGEDAPVTFNFKRVSTIHNITIKGLPVGETVEEVVITSESALVGEYTPNENPAEDGTWAFKSEQENVITLTCDETVASDGTISVWVISRPLTGAALTVDLTTGSGKMFTKTTAAALNLAAGNVTGYKCAMIEKLLKDGDYVIAYAPGTDDVMMTNGVRSNAFRGYDVLGTEEQEGKLLVSDEAVWTIEHVKNNTYTIKNVNENSYLVGWNTTTNSNLSFNDSEGSVFSLTKTNEGKYLWGYTLDETTRYIGFNKQTNPKRFGCYMANQTSQPTTLDVYPAKAVAACDMPEISYDSETNTVSISAGDGESIYYTMDGTDPTTSSTLYSGSFVITETKTISAIAYKIGMRVSAVASKQCVVAGTGINDDMIDQAAIGESFTSTGSGQWNEFDYTGDSGAQYHIRSMMYTGENALQWNASGYLYTQTSVGYLKKITVTGASKAIKVFASNTAYTFTGSSNIPSQNVLFTMNTTNGYVYDFSSLQTKYEYICLVGGTTGIAVGTVKIEWEAPSELTGIEITTPPTKVVYHDGELFDKTGMVVTGTYDDGSTKDVTNNCTIEPSTGLTAGTTKVTITCGDFTADQTIEVRQAWALQSISVKTNPTKMTYYVDDQFDPTGMVLTGVYNDGVENENRDITNGYSCSKTFTEVSDNESVTVSFERKECALTGIQVLAKAVLKSFAVTPSTVGPVAATAYNSAPITITADNDVAWTVSLIEGSSSDITFAESGSGSQSYNVQLTANAGAARSFKLRFSTDAYVTTSSYDVTISQAAGKEPDPVTVTETFENQDSDTSYNGQKTYEANDSNAGISWYVEHGTVSTGTPLNGSKSMQMRAYYAKSSNSTTWNGNLPYLESKTSLKGLKSVSFSAKVSNTGLKYNILYSTDGTAWTEIKSNQSFSNTSAATITFDIPESSQEKSYFIRIAVSTASTHTNSPKSAGSFEFRVDDISLTYYE